MSQNLSSVDSSIPVAPARSQIALIDGVNGFDLTPIFNLHSSDQSVVGGHHTSNHSSAYTRHSKTSRKSQERTLEIFQRLNSPQTVVEKLESAKYERFFGTPTEHVKSKEARKDEIRKYYSKKSFFKQKYLNLLGVPSPFPYLHKPNPPSYPLPAIEGSILSVERPSIAGSKLADEIPKVTSLYENPTKVRRYDAKRFDYERKHMPFLDRKNATTSIDVLKTARVKSELDRRANAEQEIIPVAQQAHEWGFKLRGYNPPRQGSSQVVANPSAHNNNKISSIRKLLEKSKSKSIFLKSRSSTEDDFTITEPTTRRYKFDSDFPSENRSRGGNSVVADSYGISRGVEVTASTSTGGLFGSRRVEYVLQPPHILPPNRTAVRAEKKMQLVQHKLDNKETIAEKERFGNFIPRTKFFVHKGKPVPTKAFLLKGNTFNTPNPDVLVI